jgi:hypothetical protein
VVIVPREEAEMSQVALESSCTNAADNAEAIGTWSCDPSAVRAAKSRLGPVEVSPRYDAASSQLDPVVSNTCEPMSTGFGSVRPLIECSEEPPIPPPQVPAGFYLNRAHLFDLHEPWPRGTPEITYLITTVPTFGRTEDTMVSCLSDTPMPTSAFYLNQNNHQETFNVNPWSLAHTYLTNAQINDMDAIATSRGQATADVNVIVWEDDKGSHCTLDQENIIADLIASGQAISQIVGMVKGFNKCASTTANPGTLTTIRSANKWFQNFTQVCGLLKTPGLIRTALGVLGGDDDWIGIGSENIFGPVNGYSHFVANRDGFMVGQYNIDPWSRQ